jgi:nucleoid DNA-binding protein
MTRDELIEIISRSPLKITQITLQRKHIEMIADEILERIKNGRNIKCR